jgi:hypothetical protein
MKIIFSFLLMILLASCVNGKETIYIGSTPAHPVIRSFLGIPLADSVDFIKWKLVFEKDHYRLNCQYGIGKPNTNGFINGGKWIELNGILKSDGNHYYLRAGNKKLAILELNENLIHLLDENKNSLIGTGGWAYTLNIEKPLLTDQVNLISKQDVLKDSMTFQGRTPCGEFSINRASPNCIKMKWLVVFYADSRTHQPTTYLLNRSNVMPLEYPGKTGTWKIITGKDGRIIYELKPDNESTPTYLLKLDDNILAFTDEKGNLLVGDEDFSFTLSRRW